MLYQQVYSLVGAIKGATLCCVCVSTASSWRQCNSTMRSQAMAYRLPSNQGITGVCTVRQDRLVELCGAADVASRLCTPGHYQ